MYQNQFNGKTYASIYGGLRGLVVLVVLLAGVEGKAQQAVERIYANNETNGKCLLCVGSIGQANGALGPNLIDYSILKVTAGSVWQQLNFPEQALAGTPVRIKIGMSSDLLGLLGSINVQAYNGGTAVGNNVTTSSLISLLSGEDQDELVFIPMDSGAPVAYDAVRITSSGISLSGGGVRIYAAYFYKPIPGAIACNDVEDILYGSTGSIAGGLNAVENPYNAIDNDETTNATIRANVSALNKTHLTALFPVASSPGDMIKIILENPDGGLLDANVLATNFTIRTYLDNTNNGALALNPALLRLSLFPGGTGQEVLLYPVSQPFNRIEVSLGEGLATALDDLLVYEISRLAKGPDVTGTSPEGDIDFCENETISLSIENPELGNFYEWYLQATGGSAAATGTSYNLGSLSPGNYTYYVSTTKNFCTEESDRTPINLKVLPVLGHPEIENIAVTD